MEKLKIKYIVSRDIYGYDEILDSEETTFTKEIELKDMKEISDYIVDELLNEISEFFKDEGNWCVYFKHGFDTEEGFENLCKECDVFELNGKRLTKDDYYRVICEPYDN